MHASMNWCDVISAVYLSDSWSSHSRLKLCVVSVLTSMFLKSILDQEQAKKLYKDHKV